MRVLNPMGVGVAAAVVAAALGGCSLTLDFDCADDTDCANLEGSFTCIDGACVAGEDESFTCTDEQPLVSTNCFDLYGPLPGSTGSTAGEREAAFLGAPADYVLISVHTPHGALEIVGRQSIEAAVRYAVEDINRSGGLTYGSGERKLLAALICNDGGGAPNGAPGIEAAEHAVSCGAKAMVATHNSGATVNLFREVALARDIPMISPGAISPEIPRARDLLGDSKGLLWRIKVPGQTLIAAVVRFIQTMPYENIHIFYRESTGYDKAMRDAFASALGNDGFTEHPISSAPGLGASAARDVLLDADPPPDLVVTLVENLFDLLDVADGLTQASANWEVAEDPTSGTDLLTVEGARSDLAVEQFFGRYEGREEQVYRIGCRTMGISSGSVGGDERADYTLWLDRLRTNASVFVAPADIDDLLVAPTPAYVDAVFVTAFAMLHAIRASQTATVDTDGILNGLALISDPNATGVRPHEWSTGLTAFGPDGGGTINYLGASGSIDLDPNTQDVTGKQTEVWNYALRGAAAETRGVRELGNLTDDDDADLSPRPQALQALVRDTGAEPVCTSYPYVGCAKGAACD